MNENCLCVLVVTKTAKVSVLGVGLGLDPAGLGLGLGLSGLGLVLVLDSLVLITSLLPNMPLLWYGEKSWRKLDYLHVLSFMQWKHCSRPNLVSFLPELGTFSVKVSVLFSRQE